MNNPGSPRFLYSDSKKLIMSWIPGITPKESPIVITPKKAITLSGNQGIDICEMDANSFFIRADSIQHIDNTLLYYEAL